MLFLKRPNHTNTNLILLPSFLSMFSVPGAVDVVVQAECSSVCVCVQFCVYVCLYFHAGNRKPTLIKMNNTLLGHNNATTASWLGLGSGRLGLVTHWRICLSELQTQVHRTEFEITTEIKI